MKVMRFLILFGLLSLVSCEKNPVSVGEPDAPAVDTVVVCEDD